MTGEAHWLDPLLMILGGLGVALMVWLGSRAKLLRARQKNGFCPHLHKPVKLTLLQNTLTDEWVDVERCSASIPEDRVSCDRACLVAPTRLRA